MNKTKIDWCDSTWNPVTGCLHGCEYCYARSIAERFKPFDLPHLTEDGVFKNLNDLKEPIKTVCEDGKERICAYPYGFEPTFHKYRLNDYIGKKGRNIFVCSMADLFGEWVPDSWIEEVFKACGNASQHNYLFLTKNPQRYLDLQRKGKLPERDNMWYGASVTDEESLRKVADIFSDMSGDIKTFFSVEPILEDITMTEIWNDCVVCHFMDWVIIGAETGRRRDKVIPDKAWIRSIYFDCYGSHNDIPVFMKSSLADIWGEPLIQEFPMELKQGGAQ